MACDSCQFSPVCKNLVKEDDSALQCEIFCNNWFHCACVSITDVEYEYMKILAEKSKWACEACGLRLTKFTEQSKDIDGLINLSITVDKLFASVKNVVNDNLALNEKFDKFLVAADAYRTCGENVESKVLVDDDERFPNALAVVSDYRRGTEKKAFSQKTRNFGGVGDNNNRGRQQEVRSFSNSNRVFTKSSTEWTAVNYRKSGWNNNYKKRSEGYSINGSKMDSNISIVPDTEGKDRPATGSAPTYSDILRSEVKNKVVRGTLKVSDSNPLKPAKRMRWLFLSGLHPVVSAQSITDYLHSLKGDAVFHCNKLVTRYSSYSSFKVGVPHELGEELMHPNLWPEGTFIKSFRPPKTYRSDGRSQ
ncbi:hypothetical protein J6590_083154 [Homalodisca vitripennis]|nr:hypothetical protein J6590_083154 [Homalodisca vitripennis]